MADQSQSSSPPPGAKASGAFLGLGAAILALLTTVQSAVLGLRLYTDVRWVVVGILALLAVLIPAWQTARARWSDEADQARALDAALAGGATLTANERPSADLGVRASGSPNPEHAEHIATAMQKCWAVVVTGPPGVGKTQAALEALRSVWGDAIVVCPVDADGLATILAGQQQLMRAIADRTARTARERHGGIEKRKNWIRHRWLRLRDQEPPVPAVLWLDDFERFADTLDVDLLSRLVARTRPSKRHTPDPAPPSVMVRLIATLRTDEYQRILHGSDDAAHHARRLLARGITVTLEPDPARDQQGAAPEQTMPDPSAERETLAPPPVSDLRPVRPAVGSLVLLGSALGLLIALFGLFWLRHGDLQVPPTLISQAAAVEASLPACDTTTPPPADVLKDDSIWVLHVSGGSCPASDYVSVYAVDSGVISWAFAEKPKSSETWWFRCLGPASTTNSCSIPAGGNSQTIVVGGFTRTYGTTAETVPLVLYRYNYTSGRAGAIRLLAPDLPAPPGQPARADALSLFPGAPANGFAADTCPHPAELCGDGAAYIAAVPMQSSTTGAARVLLIAGYATGPWYSPVRVTTEAFALHYVNHQHNTADVVLDPQPCEANAAATQVVAFTPPPRASFDTIENMMRSQWQALQPTC
jgi:hypothetical protein